MSSLTRRSLLRTGLAGATVAATAGFPVASTFARTRPTFPSAPWALGVASGDPTSDGVVLWTRLATDALGVEPIAHDRILVRWELAEDEGFRRVARRGVAVADRDAAHSVHVEVEGLRPHRDYWYRFAAGDEVSPVGRTRTAPDPRNTPAALAFAFASCQQYEHGFFTAWRHVAEEDVDLVLHLGDYIYEHGTDVYKSADGNVRHHVGDEITTLFDYRRRHAQYRSDGDLQAAHAAHPFVVTWDDHEVDNNYADLVPEDGQAPEAFRARRAAAYQAYWEHMPLRRRQRAKGPDMRLDRTLDYGRLARFTVLDTRQYRSDQACGDGTKAPCAEWEDPTRTFLGDDQERRVLRDLGRSGARWNVIANQVPLTAIDQKAGEGLTLYMDGWAGYPAARERFLSGIVDRRVGNPLVITGDVHSNWACEVNRDARDPASTAVAVELIGTSITSTGDGNDSQPAQLADNPQVKWYQRRRGYVRVAVDAREARADYRSLDYVSRPGAPVRTAKSFVVEDGTPRLQPA
ncbi:phosphodiesterase/alkaline phosphatase D [Patulibacter medicamentivorans]|uniref:Phosphodiesterase/alkaline phosphatase D n=1 Tax=Patulibacter medicamentivorans TaxID=1097667 RepID=H0E365_9ACTN|nr:alkaline phosphatase D family protein [Patulibacter medicamentivorans]EHN11888.1 phosphodiesterase/alkaline phosphatase D [Patulibacter medicamentivorans]